MATTTLPSNYQVAQKIDLAGNWKLSLGLNIASFIALILFGLPLFVCAAFVWLPLVNHPIAAMETITLDMLILIPAFASLILYVILHELVHGLFFAWFTKARPYYGLKGLFAYAAAPDWYIIRNQYLLIALAPLIVLTILGFITMVFVPFWLVPALLLGVILNAAGAVGDIYVAGLLLAAYPADILINDQGVSMTIYEPADPASTSAPDAK